MHFEMLEGLSDFESFALEALSTRAQPMEPERFWALIEGAPESAQGLTLEEVSRVSSTLRRCSEALEASRVAWEARNLRELLDEDDLYFDDRALRRGRAGYEQVLADPTLVAAPEEPPWSFGEIFNPSLCFDGDRSQDLLAVLRSCGTLREPDDPAGITSYELCEHPELGLGIIHLERDWWDITLVCEEQVVQRVRPRDSERQVVLYRPSPRGWTYRSIRQSAVGEHVSSFECGGNVGELDMERYFGPLPRARGEALFAERVQSYRAEGYTEREPELQTLTVELLGSGLRETRHQALCTQLLQDLPAMLAERGNGRPLGFRVQNHRSYLSYAVIDASAARWSVIHWARRLGCPDEALQVGVEPGPGTGDEQDSDPHQPYFAKLSFVPDPERQIPLEGQESLELLEARLQELRQRHGAGTLDEGERRSRVSELANLAGELVRRASDGTWSSVLLFGALTGESAVLLGPSRLPWTPRREIEEMVLGQRGGGLRDRAQGLLRRACSPRPSRRPPGLRYRLAADEGYFHAGLTADGRQALLQESPDPSGLFFDEHGRLLEYATRQGASLDDWKEELGFRPHPIEVRRFSIPGVQLGLEDLNWSLTEVLDDPESESDEVRREEQLQSARAWLEGGEFVLYWGNDLYVDAQGHVTSS